jgi:hypothetical protein
MVQFFDQLFLTRHANFLSALYVSYWFAGSPNYWT